MWGSRTQLQERKGNLKTTGLTGAKKSAHGEGRPAVSVIPKGSKKRTGGPGDLNDGFAYRGMWTTKKESVGSIQAPGRILCAFGGQIENGSGDKKATLSMKKHLFFS